MRIHSSQRFPAGGPLLLLLVVLLGASVAASFPIHSPVAQSAAHKPHQGAKGISKDGSPSLSTNMVSETNKDASKPAQDSLAAGFVKAFFRGVTLPFPMLRKLVDPGEESILLSSTSDDAKQVGFSLNESLIAIGLYLVLGVTAYSSHLIQDQPWSLVDALYFSVVTFTTVGYGDLCPTTLAGKIFTICFGLFGISILGVAVATIGSQVLAKETQMMEAAQEVGRRNVLAFWEMDDGEDEAAKSKAVPPVAAAEPKSSSMLQLLLSILKNALPSLSVLLVGGLTMGRIEGWSWTDSIYYSFITAGTLGYGDLSPATQNGRLWAVLFIPLAVGAAGEVLGGVASWMVQRRQERFYKQQLQRELNVERLLEMDADKNQKVSREEYVEFMLKEMQMVDEDIFRELHEQFNKLDADGGGYLDKKDLRLLVLRREKELAAKNKK